MSNKFKLFFMVSLAMWAVVCRGIGTLDGSSGYGEIHGVSKPSALLPHASTKLNASDAVLQSIVITPSDSTIRLGFKESFTAIATYSDGESENITAVAGWFSESMGVATISTDGVAIGVSMGATVIKAIYGNLAASTTLTVKSSVRFLGESQFAHSALGASVSSALDPLDGSYYVAYINKADNQAYYAKYSNFQWFSFKMGGESAPPARDDSIVSMVATKHNESEYGHIWIAYETSDGRIVLVADNGYLNAGLRGSSPSIAVNPFDEHVCVAYRDSSTQRVVLKCVTAAGIFDYAPGIRITDKDGGKVTNNIHLMFNPKSTLPYIIFDDGKNSHKTRVKTYTKYDPYWHDACGNSIVEDQFASKGTSGETSMAFDRSGTWLTVAYLQYGLAKLYISSCRVNSKGNGRWFTHSQYLEFFSGISIAIDPHTNYLYISSNYNGNLDLKMCPNRLLDTCISYPGTDNYPDILPVAATPYATSLTLDENGLPAVAYLNVDYFTTMLVGAPRY